MTSAHHVTIDVDRILASSQLPALPQSAVTILELSQNPEMGPADFAVPIEADPGLTGQVLKFVNSSYFGFSREISSVKLAITLVGIRTMKNFVLWSAVFSLMPNPKCGPFDLKSLWQDSLRRGLFARAMGHLLGQREAEECFAAALLQDMAVPLLAKEFPQEYAALLEQRCDSQTRLSDLERQQFGLTHADMAALMAASWNLPEELVALIRQHNSLGSLLAQPEAPINSVAVALSSLLPAAADSHWNEREEFEDAYRSLCPAGGPSVGEMLARIDDEFVEFAPILNMTSPAKSLSQRYEDSLSERLDG